MQKDDSDSRKQLIACINLQSILFSLNQQTFEQCRSIIDSSIFQVNYFLPSFAHNILLVVDYRPIIIPVLVDFLEIIINDSFQDLFQIIFHEMINSKLNNSRLFFLYKSFEKELIPKEILVQHIHSFDSFAWFAPLVEKYCNDRFEFFMSKKDENLFISNIDEMRENNWEKQRRLASAGVNHNEIAEAILNDNVDQLKSFDPNIIKRIIPASSFESIEILNNGCNPLHYAAFYNSIECYKYLLDIGLNPLKCDCNRCNVIHFAISNNSTSILEHLFSTNSQKDNESLLMEGICNSVLYHQNDLFQYFFKSLKNEPDLATIFLIATESFNLPLVLFCIEHGVDINCVNSCGETALMIATTHWHNQLVRYFISLPSIDVNLSDRFGRNALICAIVKNNEKIVELLVQDGRVDLKSNDIFILY